MPNIFDPDFDQRRDHPGFARERAFVGRQAGAERLGMSIWKLAPGEAAYPYHWHFLDEEIVIVLAGCPQLRTPEGLRTLEPGEVVAFPRGEAGAHQLVNRGEEEVRFLSISNNDGPEVGVYPDSGKVGIFGRDAVPGAEDFRKFFQLDSGVDYSFGEPGPDAEADDGADG